jgi:hypothetical protein
MNKKTVVLLACSLISAAQLVRAQAIKNNYRVVNAAVPFLTFSPDSRHAALGDAGVASSPDANSIYWNTAKLAFIDKEQGGSLSYAPWLRNLTGDMGLINATYFKKINKTQALTVGITYFNQGLIQFTTNTGASAGDFQSREFAITGGYTTKLMQDLSMGVNIKYINSNLIGNQVINGQAAKPGSSVAGDISFYYQKDRPTQRFNRGVSASYGLVFQNVGGKINYGTNLAYFLPANMKLGTNINIRPDLHNSFNLLIDVNKLMVPTPQLNGTIPDVGAMQAIFSSFSDAPDGFSEELREFNISAGVEYMYENLLALRGGYFFEPISKGGRKYFTTGLGFRLKENYGLDLAYLIPTTSDSPLANTWRLSFIFDLKGKLSNSPSDDIIREE